MSTTSQEAAEQERHEQLLRNDPVYRDSFIWGEVEELTKRGAKFDPFTPAHVQEAFEQASFDWRVIAHSSHTTVGWSVIQTIREYWEGAARFHVERELGL
jgi:hypothetical protein